jgi:gliding motility-associated-like protein
VRKLFILFSLLAFNLSFLFAQQAGLPPLHGNALEFIPNKGQVADMSGKVRPDILYHCPAGNLQIFLREKGLSYVILSPHKNNAARPGISPMDSLTLCRVDMDFVGAIAPTTETSFPTEGYMNFFLPQCPSGVTRVKGYNEITYKNMYPNIDIVYAGTITKGLKYSVVVNPGGDASGIKMRYTGAENILITSDGKLEIAAITGKMTQYIPSIYQDINGTRVEVKGSYELISKKNGQTTIGFKITHYNKAYPLIIDPWWSTYVGGSYNDYGYGSAFDNNNDLLVSGATGDIDFPVTPGVFQTSNKGAAGNTEVFIIKFSASGKRIWATYYGGNSGSGQDVGYGIAADASNNVIFTGATSSLNFPVSAGAFQTTNNGTSGCLFCASNNAFIVKLDPTGTIRYWATYYGGNDWTTAYGLAIDPSDNIAIGGTSTSKTLPVSAGCFQSVAGSTNPAIEDAFAAEFSPAGALLWGTYVGGSLAEWGDGIAVSKAGDIYLTGSTQSNDYPTSGGAFQTVFGGGGGWGDGFLIKFNSAGTMQWSTYMGGSKDDGGHGVGVDGNNDVVVGGLSLSTDFPVSAGAYQTTNMNVLKYNLRGDFLIKFNSIGTMKWSTYSNVNTENGAQSLAIDEHNNIYVTDDIEYGNIKDTPKAASPPIPGCAFDKAFNTNNVTPVDVSGGEDNFISKFNPNGFMICQTYLGGSGADEHEAFSKNIDVKNCRMAITGGTSGAYIISQGAFMTTDPETATAGFTAYVTDLNTFACGDTNPVLTITNSLASGCSPKINYHADICDSNDMAGITFSWTFTGGTPSTGMGQTVTGITYPTAGTYPVTVTLLACSSPIDSTTKSVSVPAGFTATVVITPPTCGSTGSAIANPVGGVSPYTYNWSNGATTQTDTGLVAGTYTCVIGTTTFCPDTVIFTVVNSSTLTISAAATKDSICSGNSTTLTATGGGTYAWSNGMTSSTISVTPGSTATYTVSVINGSCKKDTTIKITVNPSPTPTINSTQHLCGGGSTPLTASGGTTYAWTPATGLSSTSISNPIATPATTTTYTVTISKGSCSVKDSVTVIVAPPATGNTCCDTTINAGGNALLVVTSSGKGSTYLWSPGAGLSCTNCPNPIATPSVTTTYTVIITDSNGCIRKDSVIVTIIPEVCGEVFIPNAFSPNGDHENDILYAYGNCIKTLDFSVFDRWGNKVFETNDRTQGWDGKYNGMPMNTGTYVYYLQAVLIDNSTISKKGNVTLVR